MAGGARAGRARDLTLQDVARLAGVSGPTVSRVLNGKAGVAPQTRKRVEAMLRKHGYQRQERRQHTAVVELIFHALNSAWAAAITSGVERVAREHGLAVALVETQDSFTPGTAWTQQVLQRRPVGVISVVADLTTDQQAKLAAGRIPLVTIDPTGDAVDDLPSVCATNWRAGMSATRHLLSLGHRRIGMIRGPAHWPVCRARFDGYRSAMEAAGLSVDPALAPEDILDAEGGLHAGTDLLRLDKPPTAIFTSNDLQAYGLYQAARRAGVRIPEDLSVVGFDDITFSAWCNPPLTTVRQPLAEMGAAAARLLISLARGTESQDTHIELSTRLIVRESTAAPAAGTDRGARKRRPGRPGRTGVTAKESGRAGRTGVTAKE